MIVVMERGATEEQVEFVIEKLVTLGFSVHRSTGEVHTILGGIGPDEVAPEVFEVLPGVKECYRIVAPYKLASRGFKPEGSAARIGGCELGGRPVVIAASASLLEGERHAAETAAIAAKAGAGLIQFGLPEAGWQEHLKTAKAAAAAHGLALIVEARDPARVPTLADTADALRIGGHHMQNEALLECAGASRRPVILNRGLAATVEEWLTSAEALLKTGNYQVVLCERGIRTFDPHARLTLDVSAIAEAKRLSHLPVIADPSKVAGRRDRVLPMARAAVAAGADGLLLDVHPDPDQAAQDGPQALNPEQFAAMSRQIAAIAAAAGRGL